MDKPASAERNTSDIERRKCDRLEIPLGLTCYVGVDKEKPVEVVLVDIGGGGLRIRSDRKLKVHTELSLKIKLPHQPKPVSATGETFWCKEGTDRGKAKKYEVGIKFVKMSKTDWERFVQYICDELLDVFINSKGEIEIRY